MCKEICNVAITCKKIAKNFTYGVVAVMFGVCGNPKIPTTTYRRLRLQILSQLRC